jgi:hypothetical protein
LQIEFKNSKLKKQNADSKENLPNKNYEKIARMLIKIFKRYNLNVAYKKTVVEKKTENCSRKRK